MAPNGEMASAAVANGFDLLDPGTFVDGHPWAAYDAMRSSDRLIRHPGSGNIDDFWVLTHYEDVHAVSHDPVTFSSAPGFNMPAHGRVADPAITRAMGRNILCYEPEEHAEFKRVLMPAFSAANLKILEARSTAFVETLMDRLAGRREIDFVRDVAAVIPIQVLCSLLGIPTEDEQQVLEWTNRMVGASDPELVPDPRIALQAFMEVFAYGSDLIEQRRREPHDDLMSLVAAAALSGAPIDDATRDGLCATLIAAGNETTRNAITGAILLLSQNPTQRERLATEPGLMSGAVEEILRHTSPVIHMTRTTTVDVELGGWKIAAGERLAMLYGAANHDPAVFENPYRFDITRTNARKHLAFGTGIHLCIGQRLAQMELRVLLGALLRRFPTIEVTGAPAHLRSNFVCGIKTLPARLY